MSESSIRSSTQLLNDQQQQQKQQQQQLSVSQQLPVEESPIVSSTPPVPPPRQRRRSMASVYKFFDVGKFLVFEAASFGVWFSIWCLVFCSFLTVFRLRVIFNCFPSVICVLPYPLAHRGCSRGYPFELCFDFLVSFVERLLWFYPFLFPCLPCFCITS